MTLIDFKNSNLIPYAQKVYRRMKVFERFVKDAQSATLLDEKLDLAQKAVSFAVYRPTGYYASPELEQIYLGIAASLPDVKCTPTKNTVLHVMTQAYKSGGHTRVVQRWIDMSKDDEKHDIIILNQKDYEVPQWLEDSAVGHNGSILCINEEDLLKRASILRQYAAKYERIILHVHMDDPTALIAFGVTSFTTPIIFFNHADHLFWLGVSIADMVAELRYDHISYSRRNVNRSYVLGIPCTSSVVKNDVDKKSIRRELGISDVDFVLVTTGSEIKYAPIGAYSLCNQLVEIVKRDPNVLCFAIGPSLSAEDWKWAYEETNGRIQPLGEIKDKELYQKYLNTGDLYIGSYPFISYTATMDAVQYGMPFVQRLMNKHQSHFLVLDPNIDQTLNLCHSGKELVNRVLMLKQKKSDYESLSQSSLIWLESYSNREKWRKRLYDMYEQCPETHSIHPFRIERGKQVRIDDDVCLNGLMYEKNMFEIQNPFMQSIANAWLRMRGV